jgi:hypothetical protein
MARLSSRVAYFRTCVCLLLLLLFCEPGSGQTNIQAQPAGTLFAVGDVHGDFDGLVTILQRTGLIDPHHHWTGGKATLVQTGDLLDRGPKPREVMDLIMSLEKEAAQRAGKWLACLATTR